MSLFLIVLSGKHSACCKNVFAARRTYRRHQPHIVKAGLEILYDDIRRCLIREIGNLMEAYEVHPAFQASEHTHQRICVDLRVIEAGEHRVFEAYTPLAAEVILLYQVYDILYRPCSDVPPEAGCAG